MLNSLEMQVFGATEKPGEPEEKPEPQGPPLPDKIYEWRKQRCVEMGFDEVWAGVMAGLKEIDVHVLKRMLGQGCSHELILRIVL